MVPLLEHLIGSHTIMLVKFFCLDWCFAVFLLDPKGFWWWCITLWIAGLLDFVHRPVGTEWFHKILQLILCIGFHGLSLLHKIFTSLSILVYFVHALSQLLLYILLSSPFYKTQSKVFICSCSYTDVGCLVIEVSFF
jgi:hypothetical protein